MKMIVDAKQQYFPEFADLATQICHDIRSPLTAICSYAECLAWLTSLDLTTRETYARAVAAEAHRLGRMAANFLVLAAPQSEEELQELDLGEELDAVMGELQELSELQDAQVTTALPQGSTKVYWPRPVLRHLLTAALETALEAAGQFAQVQVAVAPQPSGELVLSIFTEGGQPTGSASTGFAFRAAAHLASTRGGSLTFLEGEQPRLSLHLPCAGRLGGGSFSAELERSA